VSVYMIHRILVLSPLFPRQLLNTYKDVVGVLVFKFSHLLQICACNSMCIDLVEENSCRWTPHKILSLWHGSHFIVILFMQR